jgi:hypothetical protein
MHLLVSLLLVLVGTIVLSYHENKEYFENISKPPAKPLPSMTQNDAILPRDPLKKSIPQPTSFMASMPLSPSAAMPSRQEVMPQVSLSDTGYTAMDLQNKASLLKDIQQIVHQEILTSRTNAANHPMAMANRESCGTESNATHQGKEYKHQTQDMSEYIKKNAIPCWGCSLDY